MPFKSEKQRKWMWKNNPEMAAKWEKEIQAANEEGEELPPEAIGTADAPFMSFGMSKESKVRQLIKKLVREIMKEGLPTKVSDKLKKLKPADIKDKKKFKQFIDHHKTHSGPHITGQEAEPETYDFDDSDESNPGVQKRKKDKIKKGYEPVKEAKARNYKEEYKKYGSSKKAKKYRAELNKYNRQKGTYGNGDKKDASHKGGKIVGFEAESKNRGRAEKSRLKKEATSLASWSDDKKTHRWKVYIVGEKRPLILTGRSANEVKKFAHMMIRNNKVKIKKVVKEGLELTENFSAFQPFSSKEAKAVLDSSVKQYAKLLRKAQYQIIKDWMSKAKAGVIDYYDIVRGLKTGDIRRAHPYETEFLFSILNKDKIIQRFNKYFGGKKSMNQRLVNKHKRK